MSSLAGRTPRIAAVSLCCCGLCRSVVAADNDGVIRVGTTQVAPTIIKALGLEPALLDAVRKEGTSVLPGLFEHGQVNN